MILDVADKFETILTEIRYNKSISTVTNRRSELNDLRNIGSSECENEQFIGRHASENELIDSENEVSPLRK